jgi:hypothetical protein
MEVISKMSSCDKQHHFDDRDFRKIIDIVNSEGRQIENSFEDLDKVLRKTERLAEKFLGIDLNGGGNKNGKKR